MLRTSTRPQARHLLAVLVATTLGVGAVVAVAGGREQTRGATLAAGPAGGAAAVPPPRPAALVPDPTGAALLTVPTPTPAPPAAAPPTPASTAAAPTTPAPPAAAPGGKPLATARPPAPLPPPRVEALGALREPAAFVALPQPVSDAQLAAVRALGGIEAVDVVDAGRLTIAGRQHPALGVDPSTFRAFAPAPSARSDALWQTVARGELVAAYGADAPAKALLGTKVAVRGNGTRGVRLGAFAAFGLQQAEAVVSHDRADQLGLSPRRGLVVAAGQVEPTALRDRLVAATGGQVTLLGAAAAAADTVQARGGGKARSWRQLYMDSAATCPGLSWTVLAAIGQVESGHGRNNGPSSAGAVGPMQFLPSTFALYAVDGDGDGRADPWNAYDAVPTAARMLCRNGAGQGGAALAGAVFAYNHAQWYVDEVLALAARYR